MKKALLVVCAILVICGCQDQKKARVHVTLAGGLQSDAPTVAAAEIPAVPKSLPSSPEEERPTFPDLELVSAHSTTAQIPDTANTLHPVLFYFFHTADKQYEARAFISHAAGSAQPVPVLLTDAQGGNRISMEFKGGKERTNAPARGTPDLTLEIVWPGTTAADTIAIHADNVAFDSVSDVGAAVEVSK